MDIVTFVREEVIHQGWDVTQPSGISRVKCMLEAWQYAMVVQKENNKFPTLGDVFRIGFYIEPHVNAGALNQKFRQTYVSVGGDVKVAPADVPNRMQRLWDNALPAVIEGNFSSLDFYKEYEEIHPWGDGNGRSGKVLLCWINTSLKERNPDLPVEGFGGTLYNPEFPPDLFGFGLP